MKIDGHEVPHEALVFASKKIAESKGIFRSWNVRNWLVEGGCPTKPPGTSFFSFEAANRLLKSLKRAGTIRTMKAGSPYWEKVEPSD